MSDDLSNFFSTLQGQLEPWRILQSTLEQGQQVAEWQKEMSAAASVEGSWTYCLAGRRCGKTSLVAALACSTATIPDQRITVLAPRLDQSRALRDEVVSMWDRSPLLNIPYDATQLRVDWKNGARLECIPAGDGTQIRGQGMGKGGLLVFEECAYLPGGGNAAIAAASPVLEARGRAVIITTPTSKDPENRAYQLWTERQKYPDITRITANAFELDYMRDKIALARKSLTEREIRQEFGVEWIPQEGVTLVDPDRLEAAYIERKGMDLGKLFA